MEFGNGKKNQLVWRSSENRYHNEEFKVNEDNDNVNVAILARQVNAESTVLDIGCGEGKFGAMLLNKKCQLYGIDIDSEAWRVCHRKNINIIRYSAQILKRLIMRMKRFADIRKSVFRIWLYPPDRHSSTCSKSYKGYRKLSADT